MIIGLTGFLNKSVSQVFPPAGTHISSHCSGFSGPNSGNETYYDANGSPFVGMFSLWQEFADGSGGSYFNAQGAQYSDEFVACWYPSSYYLYNNSGDDYVYWDSCGSNGYFGPIGSHFNYAYSNGDGNLTYDSGNSDFDPPYSGDLIYQNGCCEVHYDGGGGYYTTDTCGYPPYGTYLSSQCGGKFDAPNYVDASGNSWNGLYTLYTNFADGAGGSFQDNGSEGAAPCFFPFGYVLETSEGESQVYWNACGNSGSFGYAWGWYVNQADGNGGSYSSSGGYSYGYSSGYVISDSGCCYVRYDGNGGYYEDNQCGPGCPEAGIYLGQACVSTNGYDASGQYFDGAWDYADQYTDGSCGTYNVVQGSDNYGCYHPYGWKFDYSSWGENFYWSLMICDAEVASGNFTYHTNWNSANISNGYGSTFGDSGDYYASYWDLIYSNTFYSPCTDQYFYYEIRYDGSGGYFINQYNI